MENKGRSFLTMLGIVIGITSVLAILSVGDGMKAQVNEEITGMDGGGVSVSINDKKTDKLIYLEDRKAVMEIPEVKGVSVGYTILGTISSRRDTAVAYIEGGTESMALGYKKGMIKGKFFSGDDVERSRPVIVLSGIAAMKLFGSYDVLGQTVTVSVGGKSLELEVSGVREDTSNDESYNEGDNPYMIVEMPYTVINAAYDWGSDGFSSIQVYADPEDQEEALRKTKTLLENRLMLRGEEAVKVASFANRMETASGILDVVTAVVALIAAISLLVGGIGVMNIMTVSVTERTREIGIRKALGARTSYILVQFLAESAILTLVGGLIGVVLGLLGGALICKLAKFPFTINLSNIILVVSISTAVGLFFGIYPAKRAARLNPIEALRAE